MQYKVQLQLDQTLQICDESGKPIEWDNVVITARRGERPEIVIFQKSPLEQAIDLLKTLARMERVGQIKI